MDENVYDKIDMVIKEIWLKNIKRDYINTYLLKEDTLKNSFYYHLRRKLNSKFLNDNNIRIFTEFNDNSLKGSGFRADIAIVKLGEPVNTYWGDNIESIIAIIELKYKGQYVNYDVFNRDIVKVGKYIRELKINGKFYLGFIHEKEYEENPFRLRNRQANNWAKNKVTMLSGYEGFDGNMIFNVQQY